MILDVRSSPSDAKVEVAVFVWVIPGHGNQAIIIQTLQLTRRWDCWSHRTSNNLLSYILRRGIANRTEDGLEWYTSFPYICVDCFLWHLFVFCFHIRLIKWSISFNRQRCQQNWHVKCLVRSKLAYFQKGYPEVSINSEVPAIQKYCCILNQKYMPILIVNIFSDLFTFYVEVQVVSCSGFRPIWIEFHQRWKVIYILA
jgi:hypothetical protein